MKEELANLVRTFEALGPIVGNAVKCVLMVKPRCEITEPSLHIVLEYDVGTATSEGFPVPANM